MKTLLLDRDGVLITERDYDYTPEKIALLPGVIEGLQALKNEYQFFVVSNQSGIARGHFSVESTEAVHVKLKELLAAGGITLTDIVYCPHHPDDHCKCRKPATGMWDDLAARHGLNRSTTVMAGNRGSDIAFARNIGCFAAFVGPDDASNPLPDVTVSDLRELAAFLKRRTDLTAPVMPLLNAIEFAAGLHAKGKKVVTTNGAFDLFHDGHRFLLEQSRREGDALIVGVNSDASVRRYKGPDRPMESQDIRARKVAAHADAVFIFDDDDPRPWLPLIRPNVHANAETYGKDCIEAGVLQDIGAQLVLVPVKKDLGSTSEILRSRQKP